jgi:hypothetical protein
VADRTGVGRDGGAVDAPASNCDRDGDGDRDGDPFAGLLDGDGDGDGHGDGGAGRGGRGAGPGWHTYRRTFRQWLALVVRSGVLSGALVALVGGAFAVASSSLAGSDYISVDLPSLDVRSALRAAGGVAVAVAVLAGFLGAMPQRVRAVGGAASDVGAGRRPGAGPAVQRGTDGRVFEVIA